MGLNGNFLVLSFIITFAITEATYCQVKNKESLSAKTFLLHKLLEEIERPSFDQCCNSTDMELKEDIRYLKEEVARINCSTGKRKENTALLNNRGTIFIYTYVTHRIISILNSTRL